MIRIRPVKNICFVDNVIWFIARELNVLFKYDKSNGKMDFVELPSNIDRDYMYLSTYYYDGNIYLPPVYGKGFGEFNIASKQFNTIETPNSMRDCNFGDSFEIDNDKIFCTPNSLDEPFITFDMKSRSEKGEPLFLPESVIIKSQHPAKVQQVFKDKCCGLICPSNIIYKLDLNERNFDFFDYSYINDTIKSFFVDGDVIYLSVRGRIIVVDFNYNILSELELLQDEEAFFIGKLGESVFADIPNKPIKKMLNYRDGELLITDFDESNTYRFSNSNREGIVINNELDDVDMYFSGGSNGFFDFSEGGIVFNRFRLDEDGMERIKEAYLLSMKSEEIKKETEIFGVDSLIEGIKQI